MSQRYTVFQPPEGPPGVGWIRDTSSGELMHPLAAPFEEATRVYVEQVKLAEALLSAFEPTIILWDVGLGAAANAMAAITAVQHLRAETELVIHSFESDLGSLELALNNIDKFGYLNHPAPRSIVSKGEWTSENGKITWRLVFGDFLQTYPHVIPPRLVFYDPFSFRTDSDMWTAACFAQLFRHCGQSLTTLVTYSTSTAVRAAFLAAGFWVGKGAGIGSRPESTLVFGSQPESPEYRQLLLGSSWFQRWQRSSAQHPPDVVGEDVLTFQHRIYNHPQFLPRKAP